MMNKPLLRVCLGFRKWYAWAIFMNHLHNGFSVDSTLNLRKACEHLVCPTDTISEANFGDKSSPTSQVCDQPGGCIIPQGREIGYRFPAGS
jgi:hypothetical protein